MPETTVTAPATAADRRPLPPELEAALAELLAQALVAELVESANSVPMQAEQPGTVVSPPGPDRTDRKATDPAAPTRPFRDHAFEA